MTWVTVGWRFTHRRLIVTVALSNRSTLLQIVITLSLLNSLETGTRSGAVKSVIALKCAFAWNTC